ncbi:MAG: hypothetical protein CMP51_00345 [Flavobacteriales bacterium]|nr:hypothetical protein [Flavobacteriales bacterium]|tara:strand:+ start:3153 stop:3449 length:297 start_codon:yes stop_codon:yes gene_type:complete
MFNFLEKIDIVWPSFIGFLLYLILLFVLRKIGVWKKKQTTTCSNCCPSCLNPLERIKRKKIDHLINYITFKIFQFKRYKCNNCNWEGRRWEKNFRIKN